MDKPQRYQLSHARTSDLPGSRLGSSFESGLRLADDSQTVRDRITIVVIEDNRLMREALTMFLNRSPDLRVIGGDPEGSESIIREMAPDVVLLDLGLVNGDSLQLARMVLKDFSDARIIVLGLLPGFEKVTDLVIAGVSGFVMAEASLEEVVGTIRAVAAGSKVLPDRMTTELFSAIAGESIGGKGLENRGSGRLTPREWEVVDLIAEGMSNKAISKRLHISLHTVKTHLRNVMEKLTLRSRLQIARYVYEQTGALA